MVLPNNGGTENQTNTKEPLHDPPPLLLESRSTSSAFT